MAPKLRLKRILQLIAALFLLSLSWFNYQIFWSPENIKQAPYAISEAEKGLLADADILMRKGYGFVSDQIVRYSTAPYPVSHCAMVRKRNDSLYVMHTVSSSLSDIDGMQLQPFHRFVAECVPGTLIAVRFKGTEEQKKALSDLMMHYVHRKVMFDHAFDRKDTSRFYCTEVFEHSFRKVIGFDLWEQHQHNEMLSLSAFFDSSYFYPIINHFIEAYPP